MTAKYFALLTNVGAAKLANAAALGEKLDITAMAVGDANGTEPTPDPAQTKLVHERRRAPLNSLRVDPNNASQVIAEQVLAETVGGWWVREIGLYDTNGDLVAVGNCPPSYRPLMTEGSGREQIIRMILIVSSTAAVELKIDPSVVLATREYVDDAIEAHAKSRNHPDATTSAKGLVQLSSATNSTSETLAATPKAVKAVRDTVIALDKAAVKTVNTHAPNENGDVELPDASTTAKGLTQLSSATDSTSESLAATPKAVKAAHDNADTRVKKAGDTMTGQLIAPAVATTPEAIPWGAGAYADQLSSQAPFFQPNWQWPVNAGGIFVPIAKGTSTRKNVGYPTAVSYGYLMPANNEHAHPTIHAKGDSNVECIWDFNPYTGAISSKAGSFATQEWINNAVHTNELHVGGAQMAQDGNIWGTRWNANGGWLWDSIVAQVDAAKNQMMSAGSVGSMAFLSNNTYSDFNPGTDVAGSALSYASVGGNWFGGDAAATRRSFSPGGTWRCMGYAYRQWSDGGMATLFIRIA
ncbi:hypothetical protein FOT62_13875 [Serratia marcescens]|uniref:Phage tail fibre protein N-terminal domain-containing protein n=1 Tax=Serratia marcescens TaxID=615 RepID=A0A5C7CK81_SERMA|nr:phage tail protein [Serratia marcescens]TXE33255.1 hypothetical protein FOT62_13875 [Serratia marcescens]TXE65221.1 hypothetical protein FOT56_08500 [Serratia marcescens]